MCCRYFILFLFCACLRYAYGETAIAGCVIDHTGQPMDFVSVAVSPASSPKTFLSSTLTDANGHYRFTTTCDSDSLILTASGLEIAPAIIRIPNKPGIYDIVADNKAIELKEVVVKSKKIYSQGDTINYNVASFLSQNDQALADVLKKLGLPPPG